MSDWGEQLTLFGGNGFPQPSPAKVQKVEKIVLKLARDTSLRISSVKWKKNRRVMASIGKDGVLNLHKIYQRAGEEDIRILFKVICRKADDRERKKFNKFIENHLPRELGTGKSRIYMRPAKGLNHDLNKVLDKLLPLLEKRLRPMPALGWSPVRVGLSGITWGTHRDTLDGPLILVNAVLDDPDVPNFVVEHIVWHELCHQLAPPQSKRNGRRQVHNFNFRELEERYPRLKQAEEWEQKNVTRLIRKHYKK